MAQMQQKSFSQPDETRIFDRGELRLVELGGVIFGRAILQPGWQWSTCVKPLVNTTRAIALCRGLTGDGLLG